MNKLMALEPPFIKESEELLSKYPSENGYLLKLFRMWANSPRHLKKFGAASLLDADSPLTIRLREIIILRTTAIYQCEYEWGVHVTVFASKAGLTKQQIKDTLAPQLDPQLWSPKERLVLNIVDELKEYSSIQDDTKAKMQIEFNLEEQLEIFALQGFYITVAFTANNSEIGLEPFAAKFSDYS